MQQTQFLSDSKLTTAESQHHVLLLLGQIVQKRSIWRLSIISDAFWITVNFIALFFRTLFSNNIPKNERLRSNPYSGGSSGGGGGGGGGGVRRRDVATLPKAAMACNTGS